MEVYKYHYNWVRRFIIPGAYCKFIRSYDTQSRALPPLRILKIALMIGVRVEGEDLSHVKIVLTPSILAVGRSLPPLSC